jgi:hypothetical protein
MKLGARTSPSQVSMPFSSTNSPNGNLGASQNLNKLYSATAPARVQFYSINSMLRTGRFISPLFLLKEEESESHHNEITLILKCTYRTVNRY